MNTTADEFDPDEPFNSPDFSLREALDWVPRMAGIEWIEFDEEVFGSLSVIELTLGPLSLQSDASVRIYGPGADLLTIDGGGATSNIFYSDSFNGLFTREITIQGLRLEGAVDSAVHVFGPARTRLTIADSEIVNNGRGVAHGIEDLTVINSTIADNVGDGISAFHNSVVVQNVTLSGNGGYGLRLGNFSATAVTNSTITDNDSGGVHVHRYADLVLHNSLVVGNHGSGDLVTQGPEFIGPDFNGDRVVNALDFNIWYANVGITSGATHSQGDADSDGDVDGDDFLIWQSYQGTPEGPDFSGDGVVDADDFNIWYANVGITSGATAAQGDADVDGDVDGDDFLIWLTFASRTRPGDFNDDGAVNALDFNIWYANVGITSGATHPQGDADFDGDVDGDDFLIWQQDLGLPDLGAAFVDPASSHNLVGVDEDLVLNDDTNTVGIAVSEVKLAPLGDYGGPTKTHSLLPDSPAIDAGSDALAVARDLIFDQLGVGFDRILGNSVDIGATEAHVIRRANNTLEVFGTQFHDTIIVTEDDVHIDRIGTVDIDVASADEVFVDALDGDDEVTIDADVTTSATVFGGAGNDRTKGGGGADLLDGGLGDDEFLVDTNEDYLDDQYSDPDQVPVVRDQFDNINHPPAIQPIGDRLIKASDEVNFQFIVNDIDEDSSGLDFAFVGQSHGAAISPTGMFHWQAPFDVQTETEYEFTISATDSSDLTLKTETTIKITVLPNPPKILTVDPIFLSPDVEWTEVPDADHYVVQRREPNGTWMDLASDVTEAFYTDTSADAGKSYEYQVKAVDANDQSTPFSEPIRTEVLFDQFAQVSTLTSQIGTVRVDFDIDQTDTADEYEYSILRMTTSAGWLELNIGPLSDYQPIPGGYRYVDMTPVPNTTNYYLVQAVAPGHRSTFSLQSQLSSISLGGGQYPALVDMQVLAENAVADFEEFTVGHFLPLNNNEDELNHDESDQLVPDNEPDFVEGNRITSVVLSDPQLLYGELLFVGAGSAEFEFPESIKLWGGFDRTEIVSGSSYQLNATNPFITYWNGGGTAQFAWGKLFFEGISPSISARDVEVVVRFTPEASPLTVHEDRIRFTIGDMSGRPHGEPVAEIASDQNELLVYIPIISGNDLYDGELVTVQLHEWFGSGHVETRQFVIEDGIAVGSFDIRDDTGTEYYLETRFHGYSFDYRVVPRRHSEILASDPSSVTLSASKLSYTADGTDTTFVTATIRDQFGNLVEDGTPVSWSIGFGDGTYVDGASATAVSTTDGQATITLRASETPGVQHVVVTAGEAETSLDIVTEAADFEIAGVADLDLATAESGSVLITNANVADGTPVFWTISNGEIVGAGGERVFQTTVVDGEASIEVQAAGPWARYGAAVVTATIGGRIHQHTIDFIKSTGFAVELQRFALAGDVTQNGTETLEFAHDNVNDPPTYQGQPVWGFGPPPQPFWPDSREAAYFAETLVTIHGTPGQTYYVDPNSSAVGFEPLSNRATLHGLDANNAITLDGSGTGTFTIRSNGSLAANQFVAVRLNVSEGNPLTGPEQDTAIVFTDHGWAAVSGDVVQSFFGGDPNTSAGIAANIAGGVVIVGDVGSIAKNLWRMAGFSAKDPSYLELSLSSLGLATELAVGVGEVADVPVSSVRAIVAAVGKTPFTEALVILLKRGLTNVQDLTKFGTFVLKGLLNDNTFRVVQTVFTSPQAMEAGVKALDDLGDGFVTGLTNFIRDNVRMIEEGVFVSRFGSSVGRKLANVFGNLDQASIDFFKNLPEEQLALAVTDAGFILARGVDPADLRKVLSFPNLYGTGFTQADMLVDLQTIATQNVQNLDKLVKAIADSPVPDVSQQFLYGNVYEAWSLARLIRAGEVTDVEIVRKFVPASAAGTATDIDFIATTGGTRTYFQTKISLGTAATPPTEVRRIIREAQTWVAKVTADAAREGIVDPVIRYVVPDPLSLPADVRAYLLSIDQDIFLPVPLPATID